ncbi:DUF2330 domain-containing protein, partial [bacterium]|nr:DUF2330 domain-containing protein [bacterium]
AGALVLQAPENELVAIAPLAIRIFEPKQRAIILWNGIEEILLLSTDQRATKVSAVLEVIPLPSEPKVRLGSFETFEKMDRLVVEQRMWACAHGGARAELAEQVKPAGQITFQKKMGAHDVTVAKVLDGPRFVQFVQDHLAQTYGAEKAPIRPEFVEIINSYITEGFRWFAFDVIVLTDQDQSRHPIEYRFASEEVFYPMRISTLEKGETQVDLTVVSSYGLARFTGLSREKVKVQPTIRLASDKVEGLDQTWLGFFGEREELVANDWRIRGDISTFVSDVRVR